MPSVNATLTVIDDQFTPLAAKIRYTARDVARDFAVRRRPLDAKALTWLRFTPAKPHYPIVWQTERQRRAFFATNGFGRGIPTQRSGKLAQSWSVQQTNTNSGGSVSFDNGAKYATYVQGDIMQNMHIASGYHNVDDGVSLYAVDYAATLEQSFFSILG